MTELKYRGRVVTAEDILYIRELIAAHPRASRRRLSEKLCEAWQWKQANGALRDMVCRGLLLMLDRAGEIELPAVKFVPANPLVRRTRPVSVPIPQCLARVTHYVVHNIKGQFCRAPKLFWITKTKLT